MKIKSVCEQTGLTDRAVRYYIEEGLIDPEYTENYLGRRAFDFSGDDVETLKDIVVLRKYGFSVAEIRQMQEQPASIPSLVGAVCERKRGAIEEDQVLLNALSAVDASSGMSIRELTSALSSGVGRIALPQENTRACSRRRAFRLICRLHSVLYALAELLGCALIVLNACMVYHYPKGRAWAQIIAALLLAPAALTLLLPLFHAKNVHFRRFQRVIAVICVLCLLPSLFFSFGIVNRSETDDIRNYRRFDAECLASRSPLLQDLFPLWAPVEGDRRYHYRELPGLDETYDVYAEWSLEPKAFSKEIERATAVMEQHVSEDGLLTFQKGGWTCLFYSYDGYAPYRGDDPFTPVHASYDYTIFAYDASRLRVRYLDGYSLEDGAYEPYYLLLDWD